MPHTSAFWINHFQNNLQKKRVNWELKPNITEKEKAAIIYSLKAWQLGETSDGKHLLAAATKYAKRQGERDYPEAVKLFIKEEQKHGANLGKYIELLGDQPSKSDWGDTLFRKIRYFNSSMELWTITVIIVESAAQIFYQALHDATNCQLLQAICSDILIDEAHHIKFQNERLQTILEQKNYLARAMSYALYGILFFGTIHAIWFGHHRALIAGGVTKNSFMRKMYYKFFNSLKYSCNLSSPNSHNKTARINLCIENEVI